MQTMKTAFIFPGQGAQTVGMGLEIASTFAAASEIFKKADHILGFGLSRICFEGPAEKLNTTVISQPAIFVTSAAILTAIRTNPATANIRPNITGGLSLGEYTALYAAGVIDFENALKLCAKRGQAMQAASDSTKGGMVSIIGLDSNQVMQLCAEARDGQLLVPVNFNCPGQIVVSGTKPACERAEKIASKYGAIKAIRLEVAGAFHTDLMASAAASLQQAIKNSRISDPTDVQIIANIDAQYYKNADSIRDGLIKQLTCPILWQQCMEKLIADGVEVFYEIGPGRVLTGLMKRINRKAKVINVSTIEAVRSILNT